MHTQSRAEQAGAARLSKIRTFSNCRDSGPNLPMTTQELFTSETAYPTYSEDMSCPSTVPLELATAKRHSVPLHLPIASSAYRLIKPTIEFVLIMLALPFLLPLCLCIAVLVGASSRGPVFYRHRRLGQFQRPIFVWKFRTMYQDGDRVLEQYLDANAEARQEWLTNRKLKWDPRITPIGRILRSTSLDEIPQLLNVLCGEMSIVGPRPIVHEEMSKYGMYLQMFSYAVPGITGLWQVSGRCDLSYEERVQLDVHYVTRWNLWMETKILLKTLFVMIHREGAY
ncbi:sugar transferase [Silvibacterium dinghuense]|uniref:sugar transferase n=1 Tax=Silvibacterium dinghuense TaxID=1560006 RepID=UPI0013E92082|nr:sugar transferase [Silvibacterium dinghuense]